jgi:formylglycine-generating enzyme required for sulfatase activity/energy-coupling factor transporter ATP-binding protein EcfA2
VAERRERWEIKDALAERRHLVVLGDPGSGKTTLLKYLALTMAEGPEVAQARLGLDEKPLLPVILPLSAFAAALTQEPDLSLDDYLPRHFAALELPGLGGLFAEELAAGRCLVLLDGLDEVPTRRQRRQVVKRVSDFLVHYQANYFVVTSRIVGYQEEPLGEELAHFTIAEWGGQEIAEFARRWCVAYERQADDSPEAVRRGQDEAERLIAALQANPSVRRLAGNPLLLTIIALIHRQGTRLPQHRIQLYALTFQTLVETWNRARSLEGRPLSAEGMSEHEAVQILAPLALWMHETQPSGTARREEVRAQIVALLEEEEGPERAQEAADRFLDLVRRQVGLLVERGEGLFGFLHLTFEEYLAARAIVMAGQVNLQHTIEYILGHLEEPAWHEVIRLAVGQLGVVGAGRQAAAAVVEAILDAPGRPETRGQHAVLAGRCLEDVGEKGVTRPCWERVLTALQRTMQDLSPDGLPNKPPLVSIPTRYAAAETLDRLGWLPEDLNAFVEIPTPKSHPPIYMGRYPVTTAQFALFIAAGGYEERGKHWWSDEGWEWRKKGKRLWSERGTDQPEYWDDPRFGRSRCGYPVVGVSWYEANAYCAWLRELLQRRRAGEELEPVHLALITALPDDAIVVRLPTEKEWVAAAGGEEGGRYPWGPGWHESHANTYEGGIRGTTPVAMYPSGQSPYKVWDMGGNVWEWMASEERRKPLCGGSWAYDQRHTRVSERSRYYPDYSYYLIGFRVVASPACSEF